MQRQLAPPLVDGGKKARNEVQKGSKDKEINIGKK